MSTDYTSYLLVYGCRTLFFNRKKNEFVRVLTRKPLDPTEDASEYKRIQNLVKDLLVKNVPGYNFEASLRNTLQGEKNGCRYPKDS